MPTASNVFRRGPTYWWRRALPAGIRRSFSLPRTCELRLSLRTHVLGTARQRARRLGATADAVFTLLADAMPTATLTAAALTDLVRAILAAELEAAEFDRAQGGRRAAETVAARAQAALAAADAFRGALAVNDLDAVRDILSRADAARPDLPADGTPDRAALARQVLRGMVGVATTNAQREQGIYIEDTVAPPVPCAAMPVAPLAPPLPAAPAIVETAATPAAPTLPPPVVPAPSPSTAPDLLSRPVSALFELWIDELTGRSARAAIGARHPGETVRQPGRFLSAEEQRDLRTAARLFVELVGDKPMRAVTRDDTAAFKHRLVRVPKRHGTSVYRELSARDTVLEADRIEARQLAAVDKALRDGTLDRDNADHERLSALVPRLAPKTVNKHLDAFGRLIKWLRYDRGQPIDEALTRRLRFTRTEMGRLESEERAAWTDEELQHLFATPNWVGCAGVNLRHRPGDHVFEDAKVWVPLIEAHAGLRLEEAAQLHVDDIDTFHGRLCILVAAGEGRSVKSKAARRVVPVHPLLVALGFGDFVARQRAAGKIRLFPELSRNKRGKLSAKLSEWFTRYLDHVDLSQPGRAHHSLRHSFDTHLQNRDVPEVRVKELMGHVRSGETSGRYFKGSAFVKLCAAIDAIDYGLHTEERNGKLRLCPLPDADRAAA